jgi:hypothetical protein
VPAAEATAELIHLACSGKSMRRMTAPVHCLDWLKANWVRLLPTVAAGAAPTLWSQPDGPEGRKFLADAAHLGEAVATPFGFGASVTNCSIDAIVGVLGRTHRGEYAYPCRLKLKVGFGLLVRAEMKSAFGRKHVWPLLERDQPQVTMRFEWPEQLAVEATHHDEVLKELRNGPSLFGGDGA